MIRLRPEHWMLAFILALATHLAAYQYTISLPTREPVNRGGTFEADGAQSLGTAGVYVQLGKSSREKSGKAALKKQAPAQKAQKSPSQDFVAIQDKTESGAKEMELLEIPKPPDKRIPEPTVSKPVKEAAEPKAKIAAATPKRKHKPKPKPKRTTLIPKKETRDRPPALQKPAKTPPANTAPQEARVRASNTKGLEKTTSALSFSDLGGRTGDASGNQTGENRKLTYSDQVLLWLKQHGSYPYEAAMFQLEDTVMLEFAISRKW